MSEQFDLTRTEHLQMAQTASKIVITTDQEYTNAGEFLIAIKNKRRVWEKMIRPVIQVAFEAHKKTIGLHKEIDTPLARAENEFIKPAMLKYSQKKETERKAEEDRLNKIIADEAEEKRKKEEEDRKKNLIVDLKGQVITPSQPPPPPPVVPTIVVPKQEAPQGISFVDSYVAEVFDLGALLRGVIEGTVPIEAIQANTSFINSRAKVLKNHMAWPGIRVNKIQNVRATARR